MPLQKGEPRAPTAGRKKGVPNKNTQELKDMITTALHQAGGVDYLRRQADENPAAFMALVGKIIPKDISIKSDVLLQVITGIDANSTD